jgi:hypothetical protein
MNLVFMIVAILPFLFGVMLIMVLIWFVLIARLFHRLRDRHPVTYENFGSPSLFHNNSIKNNHLFLRFLCKNEFESLNDQSLLRMCRFARIYLGSYMILFFIMAGLVLTVIHNNPVKGH